MPGPSSQLPETVAAVDLGSNSFHMLVARTDGGTPVVVDRLREMVQLATGLDDKGSLTEKACERAIACLRRFGQRLEHMHPEAVRAVGTNTLRMARDAAGFVARAERALGHSIETISGIEEARLIFVGVAQTMPNPQTRRLVIDIGGGSTELVVGQGATPSQMESLYMGSIGMSLEHFPRGDLGGKRWQRAETAALQEIEPARARFREATWTEAVGASGTVRAIDNLVREFGWSKAGITLPALAKLRETMIKAGRVERLKLPGLNPKRRPFIAGGTAILIALFEALEIETMQRSDGALREGLLYDLIGRIREKDIRGGSVDALAERYHVDLPQALRVENAALQLLGQVAEQWQLPWLSARQVLSWSARLHEIGLDIAHDHYHRHGHYIVAHSDMPGFSRSEQQLLAALVRAHRRKFPTGVLRDVPSDQARTSARLAILLRLAVVLHRSRSPAALPTPQLSAKKKSLMLRFPDGWLDLHPLTRADLETEAGFLAAAGYRLEFD